MKEKELTKNTEKNSSDDTRRRYLQIRLNDEEFNAIEKKFRNSRLRSKSEFVRLMIFRGLIVHFPEEEIREMLRLLRNIAGNINQIAVRYNSTNYLYAEDIREIKEKQGEIWGLLKSLLSKIQRAGQ